MEKRALRRLPVTEASCKDVEFIRRVSGLVWIMKAKKEQTKDGQYLVVSFFHRDDLLTGKKRPVLRTFFGSEDYLSENLENKKNHWRTGARWNLLKSGWDDSGNCASASAEDERRIRKWFGSKEENAADSIDTFQRGILNARLESKHQKMRNKIERVMQSVPELPDGFDEWIDQEFMWRSRYFFYRYEKRAELNGICSQCRQKGKMRRSLLRNGARVICPVCGKELTARPIGKMPAYGCDESSTVLVQMAGNRLLLRFFHIRKYYSKEKPEAYDPYRKEYLRLFYEEGRWERYEWAYSSCYPGKGWVPERYGFDDDKVVLCPIQLKEAITGTPLAYSGLAEAASHLKDHQIDVLRYLQIWKKYPEMEKLIKCGFFRVIDDFCRYPYFFQPGKLLDGEKDKLYQVLGMPGKACYAALPREISCAELAFLQKYCKFSAKPSPAAITKCAAFHLTDQRLLDYMKYVSIEKMLKYCALQAGEKERKEFIANWADYLGWCESLGYDLKDRYYLFPKDFHRAHDRVYEEYQKHRDKLEKKKLAQERRKGTLRLKSIQKQLGSISDGQLVIVVPKTSKEIEEEGKRLHHCVANYISKVIDGKTLILFLRKKETIDIPFRTLEWRDGEFKQCQGYGNREHNDEEITGFLEYAQSQIREKLMEEEKTV